MLVILATTRGNTLRARLKRPCTVPCSAIGFRVRVTGYNMGLPPAISLQPCPEDMPSRRWQFASCEQTIT
eukprot:14021603-Heterocapsa_arctica.AAC.1